MISFKYACLPNLPGPRPQDKPCEPSAVTSPPQGHMWGSQVLAPKGRHAAILIASSSSLKPQAVSGSACSQSRARWYSSPHLTSSFIQKKRDERPHRRKGQL